MHPYLFANIWPIVTLGFIRDTMQILCANVRKNHALRYGSKMFGDGDMIRFQMTRRVGNQGSYFSNSAYFA